MPEYRWFEISDFEIIQEGGTGWRCRPRPGDHGRFYGFAEQIGTTGDVEGRVQNERISMIVRWSDGKTGHYWGALFPDGHLRERTTQAGVAEVPGPVTLDDRFTGKGRNSPDAQCWMVEQRRLHVGALNPPASYECHCGEFVRRGSQEEAST